MVKIGSEGSSVVFGTMEVITGAGVGAVDTTEEIFLLSWGDFVAAEDSGEVNDNGLDSGGCVVPSLSSSGLEEFVSRKGTIMEATPGLERASEFVLITSFCAAVGGEVDDEAGDGGEVDG